MCKIAHESDGCINGVVWNTADTWSNFERFGSFICLNVIKRGIKNILWPCTSIVMCNDLDQVCVGCEVIFCGERELTRLFVVKFLLINTLARLEHKVYSVAGYGF